METTELQTRKRHGFVTFWLWLGIIANLITGILSLDLKNYFETLYFYSQNSYSFLFGGSAASQIETLGLILTVIAVIASILGIIFYINLLRWKKNAFWGLVVTALIVAIADVIVMNLMKEAFLQGGLVLNWSPTMQIIITPISILILFGILQISKNGVSCWKNLE